MDNKKKVILSFITDKLEKLSVISKRLGFSKYTLSSTMSSQNYNRAGNSWMAAFWQLTQEGKIKIERHGKNFYCSRAVDVPREDVIPESNPATSGNGDKINAALDEFLKTVASEMEKSMADKFAEKDARLSELEAENKLLKAKIEVEREQRNIKKFFGFLNKAA